MSVNGYVQVAADGVGKRIGNLATKLPAGTAVADDAGNVTTLASDTWVFLQTVVLVCQNGTPVDVTNRQKNIEELLYQILQELKNRPA